MSLNISNEKSTIPFGIYRIDKEYISFLRKCDNNVLDPEYTDRYCGPVLRVDSERGPADYFVPILPDYDNMTGYLVNFKDGILAGFMDFKKSIPCLEKNMVQDISNKNLIFDCNEMKTLIEDCAKFIFKKKKELKNMQD